MMLKTYNGMKVYMNGLYPAVYMNGKNQHIHRLEWIKYHGAIPKDCIIHHKDEDKTNWNIDNLELLKRSEHIMKHQDDLHSHMPSLCGDHSRHHKLTQKDVEYIKSHYKKYDQAFGGRSLAKKFGVTEQCISRIMRGINWKVVI